MGNCGTKYTENGWAGR